MSDKRVSIKLAELVNIINQLKQEHKEAGCLPEWMWKSDEGDCRVCSLIEELEKKYIQKYVEEK